MNHTVTIGRHITHPSSPPVSIVCTNVILTNSAIHGRFCNAAGVENWSLCDLNYSRYAS